MDILQESISRTGEEIAKKFEAKLKEACAAWSVDTTNIDEVRERCVICQKEGTARKMLLIDGNLVMEFTPIGFDNSIGKMSASFQCSEIIKP